MYVEANKRQMKVVATIISNLQQTKQNAKNKTTAHRIQKLCNVV